ncbi:NFU domain protein 1 [Theobroma cacao]|uniref:NFU domain protein 1 n=1 Tax=Theobroma cacao TaxID=3641 RepID=A0A061DRC3_THECC|nr:NFU domain protein 1 [Theobroma cacao]
MRIFSQISNNSAPEMASIAATKTLTSSSPQALTKTFRIPQFISQNPHRRVPHTRIQLKTTVKASSSSPSAPTGSSPGLYSAQQFELTCQNVDLVLQDVRPYLVADGGNVGVVSVEDGVISLKLEGACGSCPSSTTTMKMGIERVLKEKFGDAVKDIRQVYDAEERETTVEAVNRHLEILRPAIKNYGGSVEVLSIEAGACVVKYTGPESIGSGIKAATKEKFPDIMNIVFTG